ncbi:MAG: carbohydrate kinase family protein [Firmicutes bacterium]|jgi:ribokinase|nr:carbohydrate kinase family protein [Bacillota bacterium]MDH7495295.1 carbohydrate kinase family protein [Bacillota bacterium]
MKTVVALGAAAIDMLFRVDRLPGPDEMVFAEDGPYLLPGGSTANIAVGLARLGLTSRFVGKVGRDDNGRRLLEAFEREGVDSSFVLVDDQGRTAETIIAVDRKGTRVIFSLGGTAILEAPGEFREEALEGAAALYVGEAMPSVGVRVMRAAKDRGALIVYGPGGALSGLGTDALADMIRLADYLVLSRGEVSLLTGKADLDAAMTALTDAGATRVVVTQGDRGADLFELNVDGGTPAGTVERWHRDALKVPVVDTTGAGDAFTSGFIRGVVAGLERDQCLALGNACGALAVSKMGAREALPVWEEVRALIAPPGRPSGTSSKSSTRSWRDTEDGSAPASE